MSADQKYVHEYVCVRMQSLVNTAIVREPDVIIETKKSIHLQKENFIMTSEQIKAIPRQFFKALETNDQAALKEVLAPNLKAYHSGAPEPIRREELLQSIAMYHAAFSDQKYTIIDQIAEGDRVATRASWEATHSSEYQGLPPTGKRVLVTAVAISRIEDARIVERWLEMDQMGLLQQLGLVPPPQPTK